MTADSSQKNQRGARIPAPWVDAAGRIYVAGVRTKGPLDQSVAEVLRGLGALDDAGRAFAVDTAQAMFRQRARIDAAARALPFEATRHALVCLFLVGARSVGPEAVPGEPRLVRAFADAWATTHSAPLSIRTSLPGWLVEALVDKRGEAAAEALCVAMTDTPPTTLRANTRKGDRDALITALARDGIGAHPAALAPEAVTLDARANVFRTRAFSDGLFEMQDEGSQLVSLLCEAGPGMTVVDGCAGAGGKTLHLAARMRGKGTLWALDVHAGRLDALRKRAARADAQNVRVHDARDDDVLARLQGHADVVLIDAPCSGTGVLRRNPDTSWRLVRGDVEHMQQEQQQILDGYAALVRPGGRLVYATCSLLPEENEAQVEAFLARHPAFVLRDAGDALARAGVALPGRFLALDPTQPLRTDGFFGAVLERT